MSKDDYNLKSLHENSMRMQMRLICLRLFNKLQNKSGLRFALNIDALKSLFFLA